MVIVEEQENSYFLNNVTQESPQKDEADEMIIDSDEIRSKERTFGRDLENMLSPFGGGLSTIGIESNKKKKSNSRTQGERGKCISSKYLQRDLY
jgi:hypothetical protein